MLTAPERDRDLEPQHKVNTCKSKQVGPKPSRLQNTGHSGAVRTPPKPRSHTDSPVAKSTQRCTGLACVVFFPFGLFAN